MDRIIKFFLKNYGNETLYVCKKSEVLVKASLTSILFLLPIFIVHFLTKDNWLLHLSEALFILLMFVSLYLVRIKKFEMAANWVILTVSLIIVLISPCVDYLNRIRYDYTRSLETGMLFLTSIIFVSLFAYRIYQIIVLLVFGMLTMFAHYWMIIELFYEGQHSTSALVFIFSFELVLLLAGILAGYMLKMYQEVIRIADEEAQKVKIYNLNLEREVAHRTQELKVQNEELQKVNRELDRFVYSVSHDLRAPLASTLGLISISRQEHDNEQRSQYLEMMHKSLTRLDSFIQDIINLSRNARLEIQQDEIDFQELIEAVLKEHSYMENADKIEKIVRVHQTKPFRSDEKRLTVILNNLIANSIRYSNSYQHDPYIEIRVEATNGSAHIEIHDNGQGIAKEHLPKVFDMFYRANPHKSGSGLGLYIVKETVQKLKGSISLTSELGEGTSFYLSIPEKN